MIGASSLAVLVFGLASLQDPASPVAPPGPPPEVGIAPAQVESTPAVQRPADAAPDPAPAVAPVPAPAPAEAPPPAPAIAPAQNPVAPAPPPANTGVATSQQVPGGPQQIPPSSSPAPDPIGPESDDDNRDRKKREKREKKPFRYPPLWLSAGLGGSFGPGGYLNVGVDVTYFFLPRIGFGLEVGDLIIFDRPADDFNNILTITPGVTLLAFPRLRFSPYTRAGLGPVVYNRGFGTLGRWLLGGGIVMKFTRVFLNLGVDVSAQFPEDKYEDIWGGCVGLSSNCSLTVSPRIGIGISLGKRSR